MVDRAWGRTLGVDQAKGARRVGNFYKVPRVEYLKLVEAQAKLNPEDSPCFDWTASDDQAVAELIAELVKLPAPAEITFDQRGPRFSGAPFS